MLPYKRLIEIDRNSSVSIYTQVSSALISLITKGIITPGTKLPSSRELSKIIEVNRNTINTSYDELISQGWAESIQRKGIFVLSDIPLLETPHTIKTSSSSASFTWHRTELDSKNTPNFQESLLQIDDGFPDVTFAPVNTLMREYRSLAKLKYSNKFLKYGTPYGSLNLRENLSNFIAKTRGIQVNADDMIITKGSQMGIYLASRLLLKENDVIAVGFSNYFAADETFKYLKANLLRIPVDEFGMDIGVLEEKLKVYKLKAVYIIPHHHWPTTVTLSMKRRLKLLHLAKKYGFAIIEDDYDYDFHYTSNPYLPMASIDHHNNVIYLGSLCKTFAPGVRIGFMAGPSAFIAEAAAIRSLVDHQGDTLLEEAFASLYKGGEMERHLRRSLKTYNERRLLFCKLLKSELKDKVNFKVPEGGLAVWVNFSSTIDLIKTRETAQTKGLKLIDPKIYKTEHFKPNAFRLGFASLNENDMIKAIAILKDSIT